MLKISYISILNIRHAINDKTQTALTVIVHKILDELLQGSRVVQCLEETAVVVQGDDNVLGVSSHVHHLSPAPRHSSMIIFVTFYFSLDGHDP